MCMVKHEKLMLWMNECEMNVDWKQDQGLDAKHTHEFCILNSSHFEL